jgi:hypothetical protein
MAEEVKHTPGPWEIDPRFPGDVQSVNPKYEIATAWREGRHSGPPSLEGIANASLIAAAPDLQGALKALSAAVYITNDERSPDLTAAIEQTVAAINKAEGRS